MDHIICINENSFPAADNLTASSLFLDALHGALELQGIGERFAFYLDADNGCLLDFEIASSFSFDNFLDHIGDADIRSFIYEVEDKSPAIDYLTEGQLEEVTEFTYYMAEHAADKKPEVYGISSVLGGYLLSIKTEERWFGEKIVVSRLDSDNKYIEDDLEVKNLSCYEHGIHYSDLASKLDIEKLLEEHEYTKDFVNWFYSLNSLNQWHVYQKIKLACARTFSGGRPLIDTLDDADGLKEIRIKTPENAIRVLFKSYKENKQAILFGFTKKANREGYSEAIEKANELYGSLS